jgi:Coenzyme PQQ synthesis protein D (PqqD)
MNSDILDSGFELPQNVVYREFAHETVMLNLDTGKYHGINPTAARMLAALQQSATAREAAGKLAETFGQPTERIEQDIAAFCTGLLERGLIAVVVRDQP